MGGAEGPSVCPDAVTAGPLPPAAATGGLKGAPRFTTAEERVPGSSVFEHATTASETSRTPAFRPQRFSACFMRRNGRADAGQEAARARTKVRIYVTGSG